MPARAMATTQAPENRGSSIACTRSSTAGRSMASPPHTPKTPPVVFVAVRFQNVNRPATWMRRGPWPTSRILPNVGSLRLVSGSDRPERLNAFKKSLRNCRNIPSRMVKFLNTPKFSVGFLGPRRLPKKRGAVPGRSTTPFGVVGGSANAAGFRYASPVPPA
jgi:hypothetical protein